MLSKDQGQESILLNIGGPSGAMILRWIFWKNGKKSSSIIWKNQDSAYKYIQYMPAAFMFLEFYDAIKVIKA